MSGAHQAVFQNQRSFGPVTGQQAFIIAGTYSWVAPVGVTSVSMVAVGGGAGGGGGLAYSNNKTVVPGNSYSVVVGAGALESSTAGTSYANSECCSPAVQATGGGSTYGGFASVGTGGTGGQSGRWAGGRPIGGGGAGGYTGGGGCGGYYSDAANPATAGTGGGGGGGGAKYSSTFPVCITEQGAAGGGVGILGQGANGAAGTDGNGGGGGSGGNNGSSVNGGPGGLYGGGAGFGIRSYNPCPCNIVYQCTDYFYGTGARGAVRIIWPGCARSFPSTRTTDE